MESEKEQPQKDKKKLKVLKCQFEDETWERIRSKIEEIGLEEDPIALGRSLHAHLTKEFGNGWNLIFGTNYFGVCSFVNNNYAEFNINDVRFLLFRSFVE